MAKSRFQQYMLIGIGIMVAVGFSGVFTYGNMVNSSSSPNQDAEEINATLPSQNYLDGSFDLSVQQQAYLAVNEQVVFVNALYDQNKSTYSGLENLPSQFNNRVYINVINNSESALAANYDLDMPSALVVGDQPSQRAPYTLRGSQPDRESIKSGVCGAMRNLDGLAATCFS